ncbi:hypothetical protein Mapa_004836 [Marchantia paleacea]|nr:hypothetical protein Mapa_004836 [Marchantia paleacea]
MCLSAGEATLLSQQARTAGLFNPSREIFFTCLFNPSTASSRFDARRYHGLVNHPPTLSFTAQSPSHCDAELCLRQSPNFFSVHCSSSPCSI